MDELAPGLVRWASFHPEWKEEVGSVAVRTADGLVVVDPLEPPAALGAPDHVLLTVFWHARAAAAPGAARLWASRSSARSLRNRGVEPTDLYEDDDPPGGIQALQTARRAEVVLWLPEQRAVVVGDVLLGAGAKPKATDEPLRLCPERWLGGGTHGDLRQSLRPLLDLPVEHVLTSHGAPVLGRGREALASVLV